MPSIRINRLAAADSLPATNVPGFAADLKRLRGKYLSDCSRFRNKARILKAVNREAQNQHSELSKPAALRRTADRQSATQQTASLRSPQEPQARGAFIDDGD